MISLKRKFFIKNKDKKFYEYSNSLFLIKKYSIFNFDESIDLSLKLSVDFKKLNKILKGSLNFPNNYFKFTKILILIDGYYEFIFRNLGYLNVGLFNYINKNYFKFDFLITTLKFKNYTYFFKNLNLNIIIVENDLKDFLIKFDCYNFNFKSDKNCIINLSIGKVSFNLIYLKENFIYFLNYLKELKKNYLKNKLLINKIFLSSSMGLSYKILLKNYFLF